MSGDLAEQTAGAAVKVATIPVEVLLKLFEALLQRSKDSLRSSFNQNQNTAETALDHEKARAMKLQTDAAMEQQRIALKKGEVSINTMKKSGLPVTAKALTFTSPEQFRRFAELAKQYGVVFASASDKTQAEPKPHVVQFLERDTLKIKDIADRLVEEGAIQNYDNAIQNPEHPAHVEPLTEQREALVQSGIDAANARANQAVVENFPVHSFDNALNRQTSRPSATEPCFIAERTNPQRYIALRSEQAEFRGRPYTKTSYTVHKDGEEVLQTQDARFEGRPQNYWQSLKNEMKEAGGFTEDVVIFKTEEQLRAYQQSMEQSRRYKMPENAPENLRVAEGEAASLHAETQEQLAVAQAHLTIQRAELSAMPPEDPARAEKQAQITESENNVAALEGRSAELLHRQDQLHAVNTLHEQQETRHEPAQEHHTQHGAQPRSMAATKTAVAERKASAPGKPAAKTPTKTTTKGER